MFSFNKMMRELITLKRKKKLKKGEKRIEKNTFEQKYTKLQCSQTQLKKIRFILYLIEKDSLLSLEQLY